MKLHGEERTPIVTLCGSGRYKEYFDEAAKLFNLRGYIVLRPEFYFKTELTDAYLHIPRQSVYTGIPRQSDESVESIMNKFMDHLKDLQYNKIAISDVIYVVNPDGYIDNDTKDEIEYAKSLNIAIRVMETIKNKEN